jgi:hypothetical protein
MHSLKGTPLSPSTVTLILFSAEINKSIRNNDLFSSNASSTNALTLPLSITISYKKSIKRGALKAPSLSTYNKILYKDSNSLVFTKL